MKIRTHQEALNYLDSFITPIVFKKIENPSFDPLDRVRKLLSLIGNPQEKFRSIVVSGTSGKGSTSYFLSHILTIAGYKTGLTISPHLQKVNERLQINGKSISDEKFTSIINSIVQTIELMKSTEVGAPSYFEILLAMTFLYFANEKVDIAVVEVGLEGKYDATNVLLPLILVLTNISLDHTQILGDTVEKIASEAVWAIKELSPSQVIVSGVSQKSVIDIVEKRCINTNAKLLLLGKDFNYKIKKTSLKGSAFDLIIDSDRMQKLNDLQLALIGKYQVENASLAIKAVINLKRFGFSISEKHIRQALKTAFFPGRFEILQCHPEFISGSPANRQASSGSNEMLKQVQHDKGITLVLDGAHNPAKMKAFIKALKSFYLKQKKIFILAFKEDKNIKEMLDEIMPIADVIIFTKFSTKTDVKIKASMGIDSIRYYVESIKHKKRLEIIYEEDAKKALQKALTIEQLSNGAIVIITGSLYLVGEIRSVL